MKLRIPKCPACDQIGEYQYGLSDYTCFVCNKCDLFYSIGGRIPDYIPESQCKMWIAKCMSSQIKGDI